MRENFERKIEMDYVDKIFHLSSPETYWAIRNHDIMEGNTDMIKEFIGRDLFYADYTDGLTIFVLDTYLESSRLNEQYNTFTEACDTISKSSHLLLLMHNVVWDSISTDFDGSDFANGNYPHWHCRTKPFDFFFHAMYPQLVKVQNRGVQVICISGDLGQRPVKHVQYQADSRIWFLASGITNNLEFSEGEDCKFLILYHNLENRNITWDFHKLN